MSRSTSAKSPANRAHLLTFPSRFRRRLTVAFILTAGVSAGILAVGSYVAVSEQRHEGFVKRAREQARLNLALTQGEASADRLDALVAVARARNNFETLVTADHTISSRPDLRLQDIPVDVVNSGDPEPVSDFMELDGEPFLVIGADVPGSSDRARIYQLFSQRDIRNSLRELRTVLFVGWAVVTTIAALVGHIVARRTLVPIRQSADAARSLAEGLLDTRVVITSTDEFGTLGRSFNDMAAALEAKIKELTDANLREQRFTADVAHDLRTPLAAMVSAASILAPHVGRFPEPARRPAELLLADVERMRRLVTDLLELGSLESGTVELRSEPVSIPLMIEHVVQETEADSARIYTVDCVVQCDRVRVERILANLLRNAMTHGGGDVSVRVTVVDATSVDATSVDAMMTIEVRDSGPGIPEDALEYIFDRFRKVSASRTSRDGEGSGLGLAIAAQHARVMNGTLVAENCGESNLERGAAFTLTVPVETITDRS